MSGRLDMPEADSAVQRRLALRGDYLDHVCAPLVGIVPYPEREAFRREVAAHLDALADEYEYQGRTPAAALEAALAEFGEPWQVGQAYGREWLDGSPDAGPARLTRMAALRAFAFFGVAALPVWGLLEARVLNGSAADLTPWLFLLALLSPLIAGALTGLGRPARLGRGLAGALGLLTVHALLAAALLLPSGDGFIFVLCLLLWWLPSGWLSATATAHLVRSHRRQRFLRRVG